MPAVCGQQHECSWSIHWIIEGGYRICIIPAKAKTYQLLRIILWCSFWNSKLQLTAVRLLEKAVSWKLDTQTVAESVYPGDALENIDKIWKQNWIKCLKERLHFGTWNAKCYTACSPLPSLPATKQFTFQNLCCTILDVGGWRRFRSSVMTLKCTVK